MEPIKTDILILGGGIGGYAAYRSLAKKIKQHKLSQTVTVIDQNNYFTFTPLLHEAATGAVEPSHCAIPLRGLIAKPHQFIQTTVTHIAPENNTVTTEEGTFSYKQLIVALGSKINFFNTPGAQENSHHVRTLTGAMRLHDALITLLEGCKNELSIAIVGGAYTGVEMAGQISHLIHSDIARLYPDKKVTATVIQSSNSLVPVLSPKVQTYVYKKLQEDQVNIALNSKVTEVKLDELIINGTDKISADLIIWTAGFENTGLCYLEEKNCEQNRIPVTNTLQHRDFQNFYAIGDIALAKDAAGKPYPQLGETAHKEGEYVAEHIISQLTTQKAPAPFTFTSFATILPLGNWQAIAQFGSFTLTGPIAWWIRRTAYVMFFPGIIRKLKVIIDWTLHSIGPRYILDLKEGPKPKV